MEDRREDSDKAIATNELEISGNVWATSPADQVPKATMDDGLMDDNNARTGQRRPPLLSLETLLSTDGFTGERIERHEQGLTPMTTPATGTFRSESLFSPYGGDSSMMVTPSPHAGTSFPDEYSQNKKNETPSQVSADDMSPSQPSNLYTSNRETPILTQSQTLSDIQKVFDEAQKIAYLGLCYTIMYIYKTTRLKNQKKALMSFETWAVEFTEKMFVYLDVTKAERTMITNLAMHGVQPSDLAITLIQDAKRSAKAFEDQEKDKIAREQEALDAGLPLPESTASPIQDRPVDIRFTVLSHLFLLSISDGLYDARSRALLRQVAKHLNINWLDFVLIESTIADQLRIYEEEEVFGHNEQVVGDRNKIDGRNRLLFAGLATLAGGAVIGLTAGLAAPFIGAGIGAALTTFGVTGAAGVGTFMASAGGVALITTGGVLTGGGMSGVKMMKRTRGIEQFEFVSIEEAIKLIEQHRAERREKRQARLKKEEEDAEQAAANDNKDATLPKDSTRKTKQVESLSKKRSMRERPGYSGSERSTEDWVRSTEELRSVAGSEPSHSPRVRQLEILAQPSSRSSLSRRDSEPSAQNQTSPEGNQPNFESREVESPEKGDNESLEPDQAEELSSALYSVPGDAVNPFHIPKTRQTNVLITIVGWITYSEDDHSLPFSVLQPNVHGDQYTLIWETEALKDLGSALRILVSEVASFVVQQGIQALLLPALMAALTGPMWMLKLSYLVDNPWGNALTKAEKAGRVLADTLRGQVQGNRPVTLVGFSLGARVIYYCLQELVAQGAYGLVEEVYLLGCPVMATHTEWVGISTVVSGRVVNGYCSNDMILGVLYRASSALWSEVAGLGPVNNVEGIESYDLKDIVDGHLGYRSSLPKVLEFCGFKITRDYFEDEEDEEEQARIEADEEQARINERKLREKEARLKKKQAEYEAKLKKQQDQLNKKKLEEEGRDYEQKSKQSVTTTQGGGGWSWWSSKNTASPDLKKIQSTSAVDLINDITGDLWQPKELKTTLPPLVIDPKKLKQSVSKPPSESPSLLDFDSNLDEPGLNSLVSLEKNSQGDLAASTSSDRYMDQFITGTGPQLGPGDIADRRTDFEYHESDEESIRGLSPRLSQLNIDTGYNEPPRSPLSRSFSGLAPPSASHTRDRVRSASARTSASIVSPRSGY